MKEIPEQRSHDELRPEYDFASMKGAVRGKHYERYREGANVVRVQTNSRSFDSAPARLASESGKARGRSAQDDKI